MIPGMEDFPFMLPVAAYLIFSTETTNTTLYIYKIISGVKFLYVLSLKTWLQLFWRKKFIFSLINIFHI